ncbi:MAG: hypothetical protein ABI343_06190 [Burkholderiaceae bacterium]
MADHQRLASQRVGFEAREQHGQWVRIKHAHEPISRKSKAIE